MDSSESAWRQTRVSEWTWLHVLFPLADIELMKDPIETQIANVLVRTVRPVVNEGGQTEEFYDVRIAPHNVAPFRGGPWLHRFAKSELLTPGQELIQFREALAREVHKLTNT